MHQYKAECVRVVDGDTIDLDVDLGFHITNRIRVRFADFDAAETRTRNLEEKAHGLMCKAMVEKLVSGQNLILDTGKTGKYGRWIAKITLPDGRDLVQTLKASGMSKRESYFQVGY